MKQLRRLALHGIPEKEGLRATTWKVPAANIHSGPWLHVAHYSHKVALISLKIV